MKIPEVLFCKSLPSINFFGKDSLVIFDQKLLRSNRRVREWLEQFPARYGVKGGEKLKDINALPKHLSKIFKIAGSAPRTLNLVVLGGGSVGDFGGFVGSVFKRGVNLIHIPTTWLSAIDSAHGGKTALNVGNIKNQIGTFYPAQKIFIVWDVLNKQPEERWREAMGELVKMGLISRKISLRDLIVAQHDGQREKLIRKSIAAKYSFVRRDPYEKNGTRRLLNLGHSLGHVLEKELKLPHGIAVMQGLIFACEWSRKRGFLKKNGWQKISETWFPTLNIKKRVSKKINIQRFEAALAQDKKLGPDHKINFIFLKDIGRPFARSVTLKDCSREAVRQGWAKA